MNGNFLSVGYNNVYFSNARSMARFGLLILNKGIWESDTILADSVYYNQMITPSQSLNQAYGYLWWLNGQPSYMVPGLQIRFNGFLNPDAPADMFAALGKNGQILNIVPSQNLVLVRMGDIPEGGEVSINFNNEIWKYLNRIMCKTTVTDKKISTATAISAYPNPVNSDTVYFTNILSHVTAYNPAGQIIWQGDWVNSISVNNWAAGTYILKGLDTDGNIWKQLILKY
jgi:CubicO group peptidase (beta-lactamase class C family)